jgi:Helix-turn-helix domain
MLNCSYFAHMARIRKKVNPLPAETEAVLQKIGERVRELRLKKGYTNSDTFAYENDINRSQYWEYEKGVDMKLSTLIRIAKIHGLTLQDFLKGLK